MSLNVLVRLMFDYVCKTYFNCTDFILEETSNTSSITNNTIIVLLYNDLTNYKSDINDELKI